VKTPPPLELRERPLRIACVLGSRRQAGDVVGAMHLIRFIRMSEALSRRGHEVDVVLNGSIADLLSPGGPGERQPGEVRWSDYDVVQTFFHSGFAALAHWGGAAHPFIVGELGSVVGDTDAEDGVYFFDEVRDGLWKLQRRIAARCRIVSLMSDPNIALWRRMHGDAVPRLFVPCGVDADVPGRGSNPYAASGIPQPVALFAGNIYTRQKQSQVNLFWQERLNALGRALATHGVRLVAMGTGDTDRLDAAVVTHVGVVDFRQIWQWQWHASVGIVLAQGPVQDNESSKIYYYLRTGLPVACESPIPNAPLVDETGHGAVVAYDGVDVTALAESSAQLARRPPAGNAVVTRMIQEHSWDVRAAVYGRAFASAGLD